ncbi:MAG: hypothetical protein GXP26_14640 [Planctomycetes bacterium]|nr:hypothetical protein [Planctomycetota bacterium]
MNRRVTRLTLAKAMTLAACTLIATCASPLASRAQEQSGPEMKPLAIVALSGYDALVADAKFIGNLMGNPQLAEQYEPMLQGFTQGLDRTKPIGVVVQSDGMSFGGAVCIPVTDLKQLLNNLQLFGVMSEDAGDGLLKITANDQEVYAREAGGWAFISMMPQLLEGLPADPSELFATLTKEYDLGIRAYVQNIPQPYRELIVQQLQQGMDQGLERLPEESAETYEARKKIALSQIEQLSRLVNELDEFTIGLALDSEQQRAYFDFVYTAVAGTKLAKQVAENSSPTTNFAGFFQPDAAMMLTFASKISETDLAQVDQMFDAVRQQIETAIDEEAELPTDEARDVLKSAVDDFMAAFKATLEAGVMDGGAVLNMSPESLTFVGGGFIGDPSKVESGLKKLAELAKEEPKFPGVNWDSATHADINFHSINLPVPEDEEEARQLFGEQLDIIVGIGKQSVYFALGRDALEAVKGIIDTSAADQGKSVPPMEMTFSLNQIMAVAAAFAEDEEKPMLESVADMLSNEANARDHVRVVVQPIENGARTRVEAEEGVLRAAIMLVQMKNN